MADIELVIKIDKEIYNNMKSLPFTTFAEDIIINGTPLPKHEDLKDIGKCDRKLFYQQCGGANSLITVKTAFDMLLSLPTIIEADKE